MIKVSQLIDSRTDGDCFRACVASILELPIDTLPNFHTTTRYWLDEWNEWLAPRNLMILFRSGTHHQDTPRYFIWVIRSPRYADKLHAVVAQYIDHEHALAWDPSPHRDEPGRDYTPLHSYVFAVADPVVLARAA